MTDSTDTTKYRCPDDRRDEIGKEHDLTVKQMINSIFPDILCRTVRNYQKDEITEPYETEVSPPPPYTKEKDTFFQNRFQEHQAPVEKLNNS